MSHQRVDMAGMDVVHAMLFHCIRHISYLVVNSQECHHKNFLTCKRINPCLWKLVQLQLRIIKTTYCSKKWLFHFSRYSGYILQVRWTKEKMLTSNFCRILYNKNYWNSFISDWFIQEIIARHFLKHDVKWTKLRIIFTWKSVPAATSLSCPGRSWLQTGSSFLVLWLSSSVPIRILHRDDTIHYTVEYILFSLYL